VPCSYKFPYAGSIISAITQTDCSTYSASNAPPNFKSDCIPNFKSHHICSTHLSANFTPYIGTDSMP